MCTPSVSAVKRKELSLSNYYLPIYYLPTKYLPTVIVHTTHSKYVSHLIEASDELGSDPVLLTYTTIAREISRSILKDKSKEGREREVYLETDSTQSSLVHSLYVLLS